MPGKEYERLRALLQMILAQVADEKGRSSGFMQRKSKLSPALFTQMLVLGCWSSRKTKLADLAQVALKLDVAVTLPGLHQRIDDGAVALLRLVLQAALDQAGSAGSAEQRAVFGHFEKVYLLDSTCVSLPVGLADELPGSGGKASPAGAKVVLNYEYHSGIVSTLEVTAGRTPDLRCAQNLAVATACSLHLFDLGFYSQAALTQLHAAGSYFLCRYHQQTALYHPADPVDRINLAALLAQQKQCMVPGEAWEFDVLLGARERLPVRLIVVRLPPAQGEQRRRRMRRAAQRRGQTLTAQTLALAEWNLFCTNVPTGVWSAEQAAAAYRCRWQVELLFKACKQQLGLDCMGNWRAPRVLCFFYARLIALVLSQQLLASVHFPDFAHQRELSLPKALHLLQREVGQMPFIIAKGWRGLRTWLTRLLKACRALALKDQRRRKPSTYQFLADLGA